MTQEIISLSSFSAQVIRTKRKKSIAIQIKQGKVLVRAPVKTRLSELKALLTKKSRWIEEKLNSPSYVHRVAEKKFIEGEEYLFLGKSLRLSIRLSANYQIMNDENSLTFYLPTYNPITIKHGLEQWYLQQAEEFLVQRVKYYEKIIGKSPTTIVVKRYKSRWGSCSTAGQMTFNWLIMMAPPAVIDYVVIHELCHLYEPNHSPAFWQLVEKFQPNYKLHKQWLKDWGYTLYL
jgi:hypothetical protein